MLSLKPERKPELDALRGLFLVWMALTHLPTRFSDYLNQPFGYVSSAEGFVFLSALLVSRIYTGQAAVDGQKVREKLWKRAFQIYKYHLLLLTFAFTVAAGLATVTHRVALQNLLDFYLAHPVVAILGSVLLVYCPPLLDILPMYVMFLFLTPLVLSAALRVGWRWLLTLSGAIWIAAQFGLRQSVHAGVVSLTHLKVPISETGAFDLFGWQLIWMFGLWLGACSAEKKNPLRLVPGWTTGISAAICSFFIAVRHNWLGTQLTQQALGMALDKWRIGPLRLVNLIAFTILFYWLRKAVVKIVSIEPFLTLGKASLEVFCAHVVFVFAGLALLYQDMTQLHGITAAAILVITILGMILVAIRETRKRLQKRRERRDPPREEEGAEARPTMSKFSTL